MEQRSICRAISHVQTDGFPSSEILKTAGIVSAKKEATEVYYRLETGGSLAKLKSLVEMIEAFDNQKHSSQ